MGMKVWISMGLCLDETAQIYGKGLHPYQDSLVWAARLWRHFFPDAEQVGLLVTLVSDGTSGKHGNLVAQLKQQKVVIRFVHPHPLLGCVTSSQLVRSYAFKAKQVQKHDIVVTADVDAWPTSARVLQPLFEHPSVLVWIWQYQYSLESGSTFPMSFIGMAAELWRTILSTRTMAEWLAYLNVSSHTSAERMWYTDQRIVTNAILLNRLCYISRQISEVVPVLAWNDHDVCWHGQTKHRHSEDEPFIDNKTWVHTRVGRGPDFVLALGHLIEKTSLNKSSIQGVEYKRERDISVPTRANHSTTQKRNTSEEANFISPRTQSLSQDELVFSQLPTHQHTARGKKIVSVSVYDAKSSSMQSNTRAKQVPCHSICRSAGRNGH